ncbi:hypothetical protein [Jejuia spongiicola]|uniref:Uncharacterized protein n=1 Tax=Jejuia spongiicola TaxID=2942207 RepID=A0ABT0QFL5_9FLAO|nr:hypothetical protein [Jejuia spongiicola]MCL6295784.1 hypothetical protein [Jejuia spongiicola]
MRQINILSALIFFIVLSCNNNDDGISNTCNVANPVEDFAWLKEKVLDIEQSTQVDEFYISQAIYEGETVFIVGNCCANCNSVLPVYNCEGERINILGCSEEFINFNILNRDTVIWNSKNFICKDSDVPLCN